MIRLRAAAPVVKRLAAPAFLVAGALLTGALAGVVVETARLPAAPPESRPPIVSWVLLAVAGGLLAAAVRAHAPRPAECAPVLPKRRHVLAILLALAAVCEFAALVWFDRIIESAGTGRPPDALVNDGAWISWMVAMVCFLAALSAGRAAGPPAGPATARGWPLRPPRSVELALMSALFAVALVLRLADLDSVPPGFYFDESDFTLAAQELTAPGALQTPFLTGTHQHGALYYWLLAGVVEIFGTQIWSIRLLPAVGGAATVPLVYLLGARLYGWRVGAAAAGLLTASAWSLTLSRIGFDSMLTVALDVGVLVCVVVGLRSGRLAWFAVAGILLGLSLQTYIASRAIVVTLMVIGLLLIITRGVPVRRAVIPAAAVLLVGAALAVTPVAMFAVSRSDEYLSRTRVVSIFTEHGSAGASRPVARSLEKHWLMFNWRGDSNGRHNRPGTPMLDPVTAVLFLAGLAACLLRARRWHYAFPVVWLLAVMALGVFTLLFEAPQGARTLENSVVAALIAGIFVGEAAAVARGSGQFWRRAAAGTLVVAVASAALLGGLEYFGRQARDRSVAAWMEAQQLWVARIVGRESGQRDVWVPPVWDDLSQRRLLAPAGHELVWPGLHSLPWQRVDRDQVLLLSDDAVAQVDAALDLLPGSRLDTLRPPLRHEAPLAYRITMPAGALRGLYGVHARRRHRAQRWARLAWGPSERPLRLTATLAVRDGKRAAFVWRDERVGVWLDGLPVARGAWAPIALGLHALEVRVPPAAAAGELRWSRDGAQPVPIPPGVLLDPRRVAPRGLLGRVRRGTGFQGEPVTSRVDPVIGPLHDIPLVRPFTVEWTGQLYAPKSGRYLLGIQQSDSGELVVDGRVIEQNARPNTLVERPLHLTRGWHDLRLRWIHRSQHPRVYFSWSPPGRPTSIVPSRFLRPPPGPHPPGGEGRRLPRLDESSAAPGDAAP